MAAARDTLGAFCGGVSGTMQQSSAAWGGGGGGGGKEDSYREAGDF